jgi:hypothetical protein
VAAIVRGQRLVSGKRIDDLPDHTVQGFWEAHQKGEIAVESVLDRVIVQSASRLAEKGYWMWMFTSATEEASLWKDLHGDYWIVDPETGDIRDWLA